VTESNVELVRRGYAAAAQGDLEAIAALLDPAVEWHGGDPSARDACHGRADALRFMRHARSRGRFGRLVDVVAAGEKVVVVLGPAEGGDERWANLTTFRDGRVVEMVHYPSVDDALAAAGSPG
jgi:ketosteroid isomerase-like protein